MKNGLSYFQTGGATDAPESAVAPTRLPPTGKAPLDPTQTADLLANMQAMIDSRQGPMASFNRGLERAAAWGSGGIQGPSAALNQLNQQEQAEEKSTFDMRQQMAAYRAAQERQRLEAESLGIGTQPGTQPGTQFGAQPGEQSGAQPGYLTMLNSLPANMRPEGMRLLAAKDYSGFGKLVGDQTVKSSEIKKTLEYADTLPPDQREAIRRQVLKESYQPQTYVDARGDAFQYSLPQAMPPEMRNQPRPAAPAPGGVLPQIQNSVYQTESSGGKADTSKPGVQGAIGPMQITQDTWNTNVARGVIPKNLDINNPRDNKLAGDKLLEHYYNKFGGDVDKTLAAYHGGEGAINPDGTINTSRKDANGVSIGDYIAKNKARIVGAPAEEPVQRKSLGQKEVEKEGSLASAKEIGQSFGKIGAEIPNLARSSGERETRYSDIIAITEDPSMKELFGKLSKSGFVPFVLKSIETGVGIGQFGTIGIPDLEKNLAKAGASPAQIEKFMRVEKHLKQAELEYARTYLQGQGAVSDNERRLVREATGSLSDPAKILQMQAGVMRQRAIFDKKMGDALDKYRDQNGTYADVAVFLRGPAKSIIAEHNRNLGKVLGVDVPLDSNPLQAPPGEEKAAAGKSTPLKNVPFKVIK